MHYCTILEPRFLALLYNVYGNIDILNFLIRGRISLVALIFKELHLVKKYFMGPLCMTQNYNVMRWFALGMKYLSTSLFSNNL